MKQIPVIQQPSPDAPAATTETATLAADAVQTARYKPEILAFFFTVTAPTEIYTLSLHDALPIYLQEPPLHGLQLRDVLHPPLRLGDDVDVDLPLLQLLVGEVVVLDDLELEPVHVGGAGVGEIGRAHV